MKEKNIEKENKKLKYGSSNVENVLIFVFFDAPTFPKTAKAIPSVSFFTPFNWIALAISSSMACVSCL